MKIPAGPITLARPGWGLDEGTVTSLVANDAGGHPEILAAQILGGAATSGAKVLMLLPGTRDEDPVWRVLGDMLSTGDRKSAATALRDLPILMYACGMGRDRSDRANLVYAPGLTPPELLSLREQTRAPILMLGKGFEEDSASRSVRFIRVGGDTLLIDHEGVEVSVVYDPSGPVYRPA